MRYAELHCLTNFSFLQGASHPEELAARAGELGYAALAVTDRATLGGVVRAHVAAKEAGLKLMVGAEFTPDDAPPVVLWASDRAAYGRLCRLITLGRRRAAKGECQLTFDDIAEHAQGLLAGILYDGLPRPSNEQHAECTTALEGRRTRRYREVFGDRSYLLAELHRGADDERRLDEYIALSKQTRIPLVAAGGVLYHEPARMVLHNVLTAIRHGTTVAAAGELFPPNAQRHLQPIEDIAASFARVPSALRRTGEIAGRCTFSLDELRYEYPEELAPAGQTPIEYLRKLTWEHARDRYPDGIPEKVRRLVEHELSLIEELRYEAYFLTVWDLVWFARRRGILCQGRGSAANSAVCYCLGITAVDPARVEVLFERFISRERNEAPDIDVDFEHEHREEVLQYIYDKYGRERAGMTGVVTTYRTRSAIRDAGKALGLSLDLVDRLAKNSDGYRDQPNFAGRCREVGIDPGSKTGKRLVYCVESLVGFPRHLSQHVGGMVMTRGRLDELVPIENAAMEGRTVIEWNKDDLDDLGILKVDILGLGMLSCIRRCFELIDKQRSGLCKNSDGTLASSATRLTLADIPEGDPAVYDMICAADTMGVFQIESRAQMSMLSRLKPRCYYDLVVEVAIVRPGPIQGNMVHPYLRRRAGEEAVTYPNDAIRQVLEKTLGVPIFQEQCMRLAVVAAGFTPGEADELRRAMGAWRRPGIIDEFQTKLIEGMRANGLSEAFARSVFQQIRGFGEYGFPESHAASFALLVYISAWLKHYHPAEFAAALINSQPMGFYAPAQLIGDARKHGVTVLPMDVNHSDWDCTLATTSPKRKRGMPTGEHSSLARRASVSLRLGMRLIVGLRQDVADAIMQARGDGPFLSLDDFSRRTRLNRADEVRLAEADAFGSLRTSRRQALWAAMAKDNKARSMPLLDGLDGDEDTIALPTMDDQEEVFADYRTAGLSLRGHPIAFHRDALAQLGITPAEDLADMKSGQPVRVAGLVLLRQRPSTAKGITFVTLEDETGTINLIVHQQTWDRFAAVTRHASAWLADGKLEAKDSVIHVVVTHLEDLAKRLATVAVKSRDFR